MKRFFATILSLTLLGQSPAAFSTPLLCLGLTDLAADSRAKEHQKELADELIQALDQNLNQVRHENLKNNLAASYKYSSLVEDYLEQTQNTGDANSGSVADKDFWAVVYKVLRTPDVKLTKAELEKIASSPFFLRTFKAAVAASTLGAINSRIIETANKLYHFVKTEQTIFHAPKERTLARKTLRVLHGLTNLVASTLLPIRVSLHAGTPTRNIFKKQWATLGDYRPTAEERAILEKYKAQDTYDKRNEVLQKYPKWFKFRSFLSLTTKTTLAVSLIAHSAMAIHNYEESVSVNQYNQDNVNVPENQLQLIIESTPTPHISGRMGSTVYSYNNTSVKKISSQLYFRPQNEIDAAGNLTPSKLKPPRSVTVVTVNLTPSEARALHEDLEASAVETQHITTSLLDNGTMWMRALRRNTGMRLPTILDGSPGVVGLDLQLSDMFKISQKNKDGKPYVSKVELVNIDSPHSKAFNALKEAYINSLEAKIFILSIPTSRAQQAVFERNYNDNDLEWYSPATSQQLKVISNQETAKILADPSIAVLREEAPTVPAATFSKDIDDILGPQIEQEQTTLEDSVDFLESYEAKARLAALKNLEVELKALPHETK